MKRRRSDNLALHATLEVKMITSLNNASQELVKLSGTCGDGITVAIDLELIGSHESLSRFRFEVGSHLGMVLRLID